MIQENELRVGNWVNWNGKPTKVWGLYEGVYVEESNLPRQDELEPIPLTPEILEACGFNAGSSVGHIDDLDIEYANESILGWLRGGVFAIEYEMPWIKRTITISHLHQLQNLFWCLTGQELAVEIN